MLDFFLVLGIIPGTPIQLNFFEIILIPFLIFGLLRHNNYLRLYRFINHSGNSAVKSSSFRGFIIWMAMLIDRPRQLPVKTRFLGRQ
jgi:hypothetical protein